MKHALVTGATSGIGFAIAETLLEDGCYVFFNYFNNEAKKNEVELRLSKYHGSFDFIRADLSEYSGIEGIAKAVCERNIKLSYLVINFGMTDRAVFNEVELENWERVMRTNISIPFFMIQKICNMKLFEKDSSILCVSSILASIPHASSVSYGVSKSALSSLPKNLAKFLSVEDIRINAIEPGFVDTEWQKDKPIEQRKRIEAKTALKRMADPNEIARLSLEILKNTYLTGSVLQISGGYGLIN